MAQPDLIPMPFAENATPGTIEPINATTPTVPQDATWSTGFPQVTMQPLAAGGIPPRGQNFNAVLNALSRHIFHIQGGGQYKWSDDHGPYSIGDVLQSDDGLRSYVSAVDNNTDNFNTNPSAIGTTWLPWGGDAKANSNLSVQAGVGLTGGGTLTQNMTLAVKYGTSAGTAAQGNDSRITGAAQKSANLSDLSSASAARQNLGLGTAATRNVGTNSGNVMEVGAFGAGTNIDLSLAGFSIKTFNFNVSANVKTPIPLPEYCTDFLIFITTNGTSTNTGSTYYVRKLGGVWSSNLIAGYPIQSNIAGVVIVDNLPCVTSNHPDPYSHTGSVLFGSVQGSSLSSSVLSGLAKSIEVGNNIQSTTGQSTEYPMTQKAVTDALNTKVGLTGNQTIAGTKTFSSFPVTPSSAPTANYQVANKKYVDDNALGVGQTWQDMTASRSWEVTYTNTTGRPIQVFISTNKARLTVNGASFNTGAIDGEISVIVPNGATYSASGTISIEAGRWMELR